MAKLNIEIKEKMGGTFVAEYSATTDTGARIPSEQDVLTAMVYEGESYAQLEARLDEQVEKLSSRAFQVISQVAEKVGMSEGLDKITHLDVFPYKDGNVFITFGDEYNEDVLITDDEQGFVEEAQEAASNYGDHERVDEIGSGDDAVEYFRLWNERAGMLGRYWYRWLTR